MCPRKKWREVLFIKAQQIHILQGLTMKLDNSSIEAVFVENYEIQSSRSDFTHIHVYLCRVSFFITLDIYKDYFKGYQRWCKVMQFNAKFRTLQLTSSSSWCVSHVLWSVHHWLVMYWDSCIERRDCRYITSPIGYWGKSSIVD